MAELAAGTKERGDCHIDFLAVECITRSPPFPLLSLSLRHRRSSMIRRSREYYPSSFLLKRVGCIFNTKRVSLPSMLFFFSFRSFPGRAAIFCTQKRVRLLSLAQDLLETAYEYRERDAVANWFSRTKKKDLQIFKIRIMLNFSPSSYVLWANNLVRQGGGKKNWTKLVRFEFFQQRTIILWKIDRTRKKRRGNRIYWTGGNGDSRTWRQRGGAHTQFTT